MNYLENLKALRQAVADEPEELLDLNVFEQHRTCGTLHCTLGLAATLPHFNTQGLRFSAGYPVILDDDGAELPEWQGLERIFGVYGDIVKDADAGEDTYIHLFASFGGGRWDRELRAGRAQFDHKELALARLDKAISLWETT